MKEALLYELIFKILNMSITATFMTLAVILLRLLLRKAPKWISYALWSVVLFRLICPVSFSAAFSLLGGIGAPAAESGIVSYIPENIVHTEYPRVDLIIPRVNEAINDSLPKGEEQLVADPLEFPSAIAVFIWFLGLIGMLGYGVGSYLLLRRRVSDATRLEGNVYETDAIASPFVFGLLRPRIYLPVGLSEPELGYVLLHERTHIRRRDYLIKLLSFLALSVHWFNPVIWLACRLMSRDMEMSCDERIIRDLGRDQKADYGAALLRLNGKRPILAGSPLAFVESGAKKRIRNVLRYQKPAFWIVAAAVGLAAAAAVCLLANPASRPAGEKFETGYSAVAGGGSDYDGIEMTMRELKLDAVPTILTVTWKNNSDAAVTFGDSYWIYRYENGKWVSCVTETDIAFDGIGYSLPPGEEKVKNYYNHSFDLSRTGRYRMESSFILDKDIPITEDKELKVWLEFEISGKAPSSRVLEEGVYAVDEVLYINPLRFSYHVDETGRVYAPQLFAVEKNGFRVSDSESFREHAVFSNIDWRAEALDLEAWYGMFQNYGVDVGGYASRLMYEIAEDYRLYRFDGEVWLAELNGGKLWTLYKLKKTEYSPSDITGPVIPENETVRVDSPDGSYRAEAYGTNRDITAGGMYPYEGLRVIRNSDEAAIWKGPGYYRAEFLWNKAGRYVAVYGEARIYGLCFVVDAQTGNVIELPDIHTVASRYGPILQPDENRPDPYCRVLEWVDDTTVRVGWRWISAEGEEVSGSYECDLLSGDFVAYARA